MTPRTQRLTTTFVWTCAIITLAIILGYLAVEH